MSAEHLPDPGSDAQARRHGLLANPWIRANRARIRVFLGCCASAGILLVIARELRWDVGPFPALLALLPGAGLACIAVAVLSWRLRMNAVMVSASAVVAVVAYLWLPAFTVDPQSHPIAGSAPIRTMSFNCMGNPATAVAALTQARERSVDVLVVVEAVPEVHAAFTAAAKAAGFTHDYLEPADQVGIFSRLPMVEVRSLPMYFGGKVAKLRLDAGSLTIVAAHPQSPRYANANAWRRDQQQLRDVVAAAPDGPMLVVGDLNSTRDNDSLRDFSAQGFLDAADVNGRGWQGTWSYGPDNWALVPIDHILGRGVNLAEYATLAIAGSDHRAVVADVYIPRHRHPVGEGVTGGG